MKHKTIADLKPGEEAFVQRIKNSPLSAKLMEMGLLPGVHIKMILQAPFGDPLAIEILGYQLALRKEEAELIQLV